jgi:hypothetical protein
MRGDELGRKLFNDEAVQHTDPHFRRNDHDP